MKAGLAMIEDGLFVEGTNRWAVHLRRQVNLIDDIGSACPKLTNFWLHMGNTLDWMLTKRLRLLTHIEEKKPVDAPTEVCYIEAAAVAAVMVVVNAMFTKIQAKDMIILQQYDEIEQMVCRLYILVSAELLPDDLNLVSADDVRSLRWRLPAEALINFIEDQGSFVCYLLCNLSLGDKQKVLREIGEFILHIVDDICDV
uniref:Uncharacterized protein n=1 Tax=Hyaloperonospora arabidopsidis (strain Emoy2) TaxID=559515 RepID=M4B4L8_HYAAE